MNKLQYASKADRVYGLGVCLRSKEVMCILWGPLRHARGGPMIGQADNIAVSFTSVYSVCTSASIF